MKCIDSATKGFEIWSDMSDVLRMQSLLKFIDILDSNGYDK